MIRFSTACLAFLSAMPVGAQELSFTPEVPPSLADLSAWLDAQGRVVGASYANAAADLDGDGTDEAFLKVTEPTWCNGDLDHCRVVILRKEDGGWTTYGYPYAKSMIVLETVTAGWRDLQVDDHVEVKGEGAGAHYMLKP